MPLVTDTEGKTALIAEMKRGGKEGFVLKNLDAPYRSGEGPAQVKFQFRKSASFIAGVPSPDALYYVVIARRNGVPAAIGFLVPHLPEVIDFRTKAVPVDEVERMTGLNFMPALGEPSQIETTVEPVWLQTRFAGGSRDDER